MTDTTIDNGSGETGSSETGTVSGTGDATAATAGTSTTADTLKDNIGKYGAQATEKARAFADTGKDRATDALGQLSQMLNDAAGQVDERLGTQYGAYARSAADQVTSLAEQLKAKDVDAIVDDARGYIRKSPAVAIGVAAALGFVVARLVQSGIDADADRDGA